MVYKDVPLFVVTVVFFGRFLYNFVSCKRNEYSTITSNVTKIYVILKIRCLLKLNMLTFEDDMNIGQLSAKVRPTSNRFERTHCKKYCFMLFLLLQNSVKT